MFVKPLWSRMTAVVIPQPPASETGNCNTRVRPLGGSRLPVEEEKK